MISPGTRNRQPTLSIGSRAVIFGSRGPISLTDISDIRKTVEQEAAQLKAAWSQIFLGDRDARKRFAEKYSVSVAWVGLLLNGHTPISPLWKRRLAEYMGLKPEEVWPEFDLVAAIEQQLPEHVAELLRNALSSDPDTVRAVSLILEKSRRE